ncbi:unnamed protein product [Paramecium sonneborni]|uniref:Uncharacterized protein n=1 Tax=Paramecium sonneborni TaxID=65129 RepID=A0A8S1QAT2_9CILI|nr:unnamed protein product [Paramecium sonneborni]
MKSLQKGYLELNQIWLSRQEYDAHKKRLQQNQRMSPPKDYRIYEQVKKTQYLNNRKRELMKWQTIQEQNAQILARLAKISNRSPTVFQNLNWKASQLVWYSKRQKIIKRTKITNRK